jgi:hypothetical protein
MASWNLFTEVGLQLLSYLIVFLGLGLVSGAFWFRNQSADWRAGARGIYTNSIEDLPYPITRTSDTETAVDVKLKTEQRRELIQLQRSAEIEQRQAIVIERDRGYNQRGYGASMILAN